MPLRLPPWMSDLSYPTDVDGAATEVYIAEFTAEVAIAHDGCDDVCGFYAGWPLFAAGSTNLCECTNYLIDNSIYQAH